jgi:hypothetical protein
VLIGSIPLTKGAAVAAVPDKKAGPDGSPELAVSLWVERGIPEAERNGEWPDELNTA